MSKFFKQVKTEPRKEVPNRLLKKEWDIKTAKWHYVLYQKTYSLGTQGDNTYPYLDPVASGDKAWADKTAKHYGLAIKET